MQVFHLQIVWQRVNDTEMLVLAVDLFKLNTSSYLDASDIFESLIYDQIRLSDWGYNSCNLIKGENM